MNKEYKLNIRQFTILVTFFTIGSSIVIVPGTVTAQAQNNAWITQILNLIIALTLVSFYNKLGQLFQGKDFFTYTENIVGKWISKMISFLYLFFYMILITALLGEVGDFISTEVISETPMEALIILIVFVMMIGARYGIETISMSAEMLFPFIFFLFLVLFSFLLPQAKLENLLPVMENGIKPILLSSFNSLGLPYFELFVFMFIYPLVKEEKHRGKGFLLGVFQGGLISFLITFFALLVLGSESTSRLHFAGYTMVKTISIGHTIERIEAFLSAIWFSTIFMKISIVFYGITLLLKHIFHLQNKKITIFPLGMFLLFAPFYLAPHVIYLRNFVAHYWTLFSGTFAVFIPLLLMVIGKLKKVPLHR